MDIIIPIIAIILIIFGKLFAIWLLSEIMNKRE